MEMHAVGWTLAATFGGLLALSSSPAMAGKQPILRFLLGVLFVGVVTGCGGSGTAATSAPSALVTTPDSTVMPPDPLSTAAPPTVPLPTASEPAVPSPTVVPPMVSLPTGNSIQGRYVGTVTIDGVDYFGDLLRTVDGATRLYVGGPYSDSGALQLTKAENSAQFVGNMDARSGFAAGTGVIIGQECSEAVVRRFCGKPASGEITLSTDADVVSGEIRVTTDAGVESWRLQLRAWNNYYVLPARTAYVGGQYQEGLAEFAPDGTVILSVDSTGQLFFQSANSGCVGNGILAPHLDGAFNVYDMTLTIEACGGPYAYLNGAYDGLATTSASAAWDSDSSLRGWLSKRAGDPTPPAALVMWGRPL